MSKAASKIRARGNSVGPATTERRNMMQIELEALKKRLFDDNKVKNVKFFPGLSADASPEEMAREMNKFFADPNDQEVDDHD